ncbi:MAG: OmpA-like protein, partial [Bacteroidota bacterium]|nr:OmpA-like protein [Bacteroidota bacterium]
MLIYKNNKNIYNRTTETIIHNFYELYGDKMKRLLIILITITLTSAAGASAEDDIFYVPMSAGIYGGLNLNFHTPSFTQPDARDNLGGLLWRRDFKDNLLAPGLNAGGIINIPINNTFVFSGRLGYNMLSAKLESTVDKPTTTVDKVSQTLDAGLHYLEITPVIQFHNLISPKNLYFLAGIEIGIPLSASYKLSETYQMSIPPHDSTMVIADKDIPDVSARLAIVIGAGIMFKLSESLYLTPEVSYRLPFTDVSSNASFKSWNVPQLRAGVALTFSFGEGMVKAKVPEEHFLDVGFTDVRYYDQDGKPRSLKKIRTEEVQYTELFPLLPYIFFRENSDTPGDKTQMLVKDNKAGKFTVK